MWLVENKHSKSRPFNKSFDDRGSAREWINRMGKVLANEWKPVYNGNNPAINRMINEGLVKNDLEGIMLPRISVDEYLPADKESDNIVLAFFIKGVPEAVLPFRDFCEKCNGVLDVDYGDSDTIVNTSVVYVEFDRDKIDMRDISDIMAQVSMLSGLEVEDFTITLPHTNKKFPYNLELINKYFQSRTERANRIAQLKAQRKAEVEQKKQLAQNQALKSNESVVDRYVNLMLTEQEEG